MSVGTWEDWARRLRPSWAGTKGRAVLGSLGAVLGDETDARSLAGLLEQIPARASDVASLQLHLAERQIIAPPTYSLALLQELANAAPNLDRLRGRHVGMLLQLYYAGFPGAVIVQQNGQYATLASTPDLAALPALVESTVVPSWIEVGDLGPNPPIPASTDGKPAIPAGTIPWWSFPGGPMDAEGNQWCGRFGVIFTSTSPDPGLGTAANLARIRRVIREWRHANRLCVGIWVASSGAMWGQPGLAWDGFNWGGNVTFYTAE